MAALLAASPGEAVGENAALQIAAKLRLHLSGHALAIGMPLAGEHQVGLQMALECWAPLNLASRLLGISRARIGQLLKDDKLDSVIVRDENTGRRIAYLITLVSLERRRKLNRQPGQWQPREQV